MAVNNFPGLETQPSGVSDAPIPLVSPVNMGALQQLTQTTDDFGRQVQDMATKATAAAATQKGIADAAAAGPTGALAMQNPATVWGQAYNTIAQQTMGVQRQAAMREQMGDAYADKQNDPGALDQAFTAIKQGFSSTGFPELDAQLNGDWAVQRANYMVQAANGLHERTVAQGQANFAQTLESGANLLSQTAAGASFDAAGSQRVALAYGNLIQQLAKYGPKEAFDVGDFHYDADPTRLGSLNADEIEKTALAAHRQATMSWIMGQSDRLPDAGAKAAFAADVSNKFDTADPLVAGLGESERFSLERHLDAAATRAGTAEAATRQQAENNAQGMIETLRLGGDVDLDALRQQADASGNGKTIADADFFANVARTSPGVLKHVAAAAMGLTGGPPPVALDANGNPVAAPAPPPGLAPGSRASRNNNPGNLTNLPNGVQWQGQTGTDGRFAVFGNMTAGVAAAGQNLIAKQTRHGLTTLNQIIGDPVYGWAPAADHNNPVAYAAQVGRAVGVDPNAPIDLVHNDALRTHVLQAMFQVEGGGSSAPQASAAGSALGPAPPVSAAGGPSPAWQPPPGTAPGSVASYAFANTAEKFTSDPLDYVRGGPTRVGQADVAPIDVNAPFEPGTPQLPAWGQALSSRYALGQTLARTYQVPARVFTNGERDAIKSAFTADPANAVVLARDAEGALGRAGAVAVMKEVGGDGSPDVSTALQLAGLQIAGSTNIVDRAITGMRLKANGAKSESFGPSAPPDALDQARQDVIGNALQFAPQISVAARNIADLAHIADVAKGVGGAPNDYIQAALGGGQQNGRWYGGIAMVNGQKALLPSWLAQDSVPDALRAIGNVWASRGQSPIFANGQHMNGNQLAGMVPRLTADGNYFLVNPSTNQRIQTQAGLPLEVDLDANKQFLQRALPHAVLP